MLVEVDLPKGWALDAITVWPCIFIRSECAGDLPLVAHETVHLREQARWLVLPWLIAYVCSRKFRLAAEIRGYRAQIAAGGGTAQHFARLLIEGYSLSISETEAVDLLTVADA